MNVLSYSYGSIIGDTRFFRENAVLLFKAIFELNKASSTPEMQILSSFPQTGTPRCLLQCVPCRSGEYLAYKQTWPREAGPLVGKNNVRGGRLNSLHLIWPLGCVMKPLVEMSKSAAARNTRLWNGRVERWYFRQLLMVKEDFC